MDSEVFERCEDSPGVQDTARPLARGARISPHGLRIGCVCFREVDGFAEEMPVSSAAVASTGGADGHKYVSHMRVLMVMC